MFNLPGLTAITVATPQFEGSEPWKIEQGSILDEDYVNRLGTFDIVYSWGVLHHTGHMMRALENAARRVATNGTLFIAIYNDQGWISRYWLAVKRCYVRVPLMRWPLIALHAPYLVGLRWLVRVAAGRLAVERGMSLWHDMRDWVGGYPFEVMRPEAMLAFLRGQGFILTAMKTCGGRHGCNEFVARRGRRRKTLACLPRFRQAGRLSMRRFAFSCWTCLVAKITLVQFPAPHSTGKS